MLQNDETNLNKNRSSNKVFVWKEVNSMEVISEKRELETVLENAHPSAYNTNGGAGCGC